MDFSKCMSETDDPKKCKDFRDDYLECLHHRKEVRVAGWTDLPAGVPLRLLPPPEPLQGFRRPASTISFLPGLTHHLHNALQFTKLNTYFREDKLQREGKTSHGHGHGGGGH